MNEIFFSLHNRRIVSHRVDVQSHLRLIPSYQGIQVAIGCLTIKIAVFWMNTTISLINPFAKGITAASKILKGGIRGKSIQPFLLELNRIIHREVREYLITIRVKKAAIERVLPGFQLGKEETKRHIQIGRIVLEHVCLKTRVPLVSHGFTKRSVVLLREDIHQVRFVKMEHHWFK